MEAWPAALLLQCEIFIVWLCNLILNKVILHSDRAIIKCHSIQSAKHIPTPIYTYLVIIIHAG